MRIKATTAVSFYSTPGLHNIAIQQCSVWYAHAWIYRTRSAKLILLLSREIRNGILCAYFYVLFSCRASLLFYIRNPLASAVAQPQFSRYISVPRGECVAIYWPKCCLYFPPVKSNWETIACTKTLRWPSLRRLSRKPCGRTKDCFFSFLSFNWASKTLIFQPLFLSAMATCMYVLCSSIIV